MIRPVLLFVLHHFHWDIINALGSIPSGDMVGMLRGFSYLGLVLSSLLSTAVIDLVIVNKGMILFGYFGDSVIFILFINLHSLMYAPVLPSSEIIQITIGNNVTGFSTAVEDHILFGFLGKGFSFGSG